MSDAVTPTSTPRRLSAAGEPLATPAVRLGSYLLDIFFLFVTLFIGWLIWALIVWGKGTTPGHQVLRLYIVNEQNGKTATWGRMALREFVMKGLVGGFLSTITLGIYWVVDSLFVIRDDRRTIHDMLSSTVVVQR
jgi:uncharacterized RDD family membrane protein YckC